MSFLFSTALAQDWSFDANTQQAYNLTLNLQTTEALQLLPNPTSAQEHYVVSLAHTLELLITEDGERFTEYERVFQKQLERKLKSSTAEDVFLQAELHLHWTFIYLKFGHELDAAMNLRQAYQYAQEVKNKFPTFAVIKKTSGLLEIIIGSVPEKYDWILNLLGMHGSIKLGLKDLEDIRNTNSSLSFEADLLYCLIQGFVLQHPGNAMNELNSLIQQHPDSRLALFVGASLSIKNAQSEIALNMLIELSNLKQGLPLYYADYLRGEIYLHKADYLNSIAAYRWFINHYAGQNYIKDAYYKIGLCYWLNGSLNDAYSVFKQAKTMGKEATEADKYAARSLSESEFPHIKLTKARYSFDGGYYTDAQKILESITAEEIPSKRDQVEFYYRQARLAQKTDHLTSAKLLYKKTIDLNEEEAWYFAPNSCLQLGYISVEEGDNVSAKSYFQKALAYKKHEYKNSIDSKAKSALAQLDKGR